MAEEDEWEQVAHALERITRDPLADADDGAVRVVGITDPAGRRRYQEATITVVPIVAGVAGERLTMTEMVFDRRYWPAEGRVLPARISRSDPSVIEVDWDALAR